MTKTNLSFKKNVTWHGWLAAVSVCALCLGQTWAQDTGKKSEDSVLDGRSSRQ